MSRHGVMVLDKPPGMSSAKALEPLRALGDKVGHAGTLDPFATGVLLALLGDATRLSEIAMSLRKRYEATVRFGQQTDTLDPEGSVVAEADPGADPPLRLVSALAELTGEILQEPPAYSALKVRGRRAYRLAREGEEVALTPRRVVVYAMELTATRWPEVDLCIECGGGTYIRSLARDLGRLLGLPAHLRKLRRTRIGPFEASMANELLPPERLLEAAAIPLLDVEREDGWRFACGMTVARADCEGRVGIRCGGLLVGIGEAGHGVLQPRTVFSSARQALA